MANLEVIYKHTETGEEYGADFDVRVDGRMNRPQVEQVVRQVFIETAETELAMGNGESEVLSARLDLDDGDGHYDGWSAGDDFSYLA